MFTHPVLGLDIGSYSVKAVQLEVGLRTVRFGRFEECVFPEGISAEEREATIQLFLEQNDFPREHVVCAISTACVTQRHLRFPFRGSKQIASAIPFELDEELPFPLEGMILTHERVLAHPERTDVLVVLSPRDQVRTCLEALHALEIHPRILEVEGAVLANLCTLLNLSDTGRLMLDIGHSKTNLCLLVDGKPVLLRSIPVAGRDLTEALSKDLNLSWEVAETAKHESGIFEPGTTRPISASIVRLLDQLVRETLRSLQSIVGGPLDAIAPSEIVLVGGSARLEGLSIFFEEETGLPCSVLNVTGANPNAEPLAGAGPARFAQAAALALRGAPSERVTRLDLRQNEFVYTPDLSGLSSQLRLAMALFAACLILWPLSLWSDVRTKSDQAEVMRSRLVSTCVAVIPSADCSADPYERLETELRSKRELAEHLGVTSSGLSVLKIVLELSQRISPSLNISLGELKIERHSLLMRGHARDLESVGRMKQSLNEIAGFESVPDPSTQRDPKLGGQSFSLSIKFREGT